jgi:hypothetical protein
MARYLANDLPGRPGSVRSSRAYHDKVLNNPAMNRDHRNIGLVGTADGIPCFKDKNARTVVPCMLRTVMDDELGLNLKNVHLFGLVPNYYSVYCPDTGKKIRVKKKTSFLTAVTTMLTDELLGLYHEGTAAQDHSQPIDSPLFKFKCRAVLLFWYDFIFKYYIHILI